LSLRPNLCSGTRRIMTRFGNLRLLYTQSTRERGHEIIEHCNVMASVPAFYR